MVRINPFVIQNIKNPSEEIQLEAIKSDAYLISCIKKIPPKK